MWIDSKDYLTDNELSLGAKGTYAFFKAFENEHITLEKLEQSCNNGSASCKSFVNELVEKGYIEKDYTREKGRVTGIKYTLPEKVRKLSNGEKSGDIGFLYLFKKDDEYKIGITRNVKNRSIAVKGSSKDFSIICYEKVEDYGNKEGELHNYFSDKRIRGEWFNLNDNDIEYIKSKLNEWKLDYVKPKRKIKYSV